MSRKNSTVKIRATASNYVREDERNRRRKRLAARKSHQNRNVNTATYREAQDACGS